MVESTIGEEMIVGGAVGAGPGPMIKESDTANFAADVIEASNDRPIIVDFWAEWCGPCKQLGPLLEKVVTEANGAVAMVKVDVDANQALAGQLRIQSIPTVYAFRNGQPVDAFQGALPESQLKSWVESLIEKHGGGLPASPVEDALEAAKQAEDAGDKEAAAAIYAQVLAHDGDNVAALAGMGRALVASGKIDEARALFEPLADEVKSKAEIQAIISGIELAEQGEKAAGRVDELRAAVAANGNDHQARFDLAMALYAGDDAETAMTELLEIIRRDGKWNDEAARLQLLKFFEALGPTDPRTIEARRQLSAALFS